MSGTELISGKTNFIIVNYIPFPIVVSSLEYLLLTGKIKIGKILSLFACKILGKSLG